MIALRVCYVIRIEYFMGLVLWHVWDDWCIVNFTITLRFSKIYSIFVWIITTSYEKITDLTLVPDMINNIAFLTFNRKRLVLLNPPFFPSVPIFLKGNICL